MAKVVKTRWTYKGVTKEAWACRYVDASGRRRQWIPKSHLRSDAELFRQRIEAVEAAAAVTKGAFQALGAAECGRDPRPVQGFAGDLLHGESSIAKFLGVPVAAVHDLTMHGSITTFRLGAVLCALRSTLRAEVTSADHAGREAAKAARAMAAAVRASEEATAVFDRLRSRARDRSRLQRRGLDPAELAGVETRRSMNGGRR